MAQDITDPISHIQWKKVVLNNYATFKNFNDLSWGSGFLLNYNNDVIACTARDLTGTIYSHGDRIMVNDFDEELNYWKMYVPDDPTQYVIMDTLIMKKRIEKSFLIFSYSVPFLAFSIKKLNNNIIPLEADVSRIKNNDTLFLVGYDDDHNLKIVESIVETALNEKYAEPDMRVKTNEFLYYSNFIGSPIVKRDGSVVGIVNRAYRLKKNKRGKIINEDKVSEGSYYEYFVNGTEMRLILGKDYGKK